MNDNPLLDVLTREGVLLNVSVRFWRGCKKLKAEDIGLDPGNVSDRLISLGHKRLLPKEATAALALVEGRAHALVEACSFPFLNGLAHFLPNTKLEEVTGKLKELEEEFWKAKGEFIQRYARLRESAAKEWRAMAQKLVPDPERWWLISKRRFPRRKRWIASLASKPSCSRLQSRNGWAWTWWRWRTISGSCWPGNRPRRGHPGRSCLAKWPAQAVNSQSGGQ